jgi:hypothetical protein
MSSGFGLPGPLETIIIGLMCLVVFVIPVVVVLIVIFAASRRKQAVATTPSLSPCSDCNRPISIHAESCPHCGAPLKKGK